MCVHVVCMCTRNINILDQSRTSQSSNLLIQYRHENPYVFCTKLSTGIYFLDTRDFFSDTRDFLRKVLGGGGSGGVNVIFNL